MPPDSTAETVRESVTFEDVTVDPDAVLEAFGADSPEALLEETRAAGVRTDAARGGPAHEGNDADRSADAEREAIGAVAEGFFGERADVAAAARSETRSNEGAGATDEAETPDAECPEGGAPEVVVSRPTVVVEAETDDVFESLPQSDSALSKPEDSEELDSDATAEAAGESSGFEDVAVDPDAVLDAFGDESPDEIATSAETGPARSAAEEREAIDAVAGAFSERAGDSTTARSRAERARTDEDTPESVVSRPVVVVDEDTNDGFESICRECETASAAVDDEEPGLVGPSPDPRRVENDRFGSSVPSGSSVE